MAGEENEGFPRRGLCCSVPDDLLNISLQAWRTAHAVLGQGYYTMDLHSRHHLGLLVIHHPARVEHTLDQRRFKNSPV